MDLDPRELVPLEAGLPKSQPRCRRRGGPGACYKGPIRLCRLLALMILLPSLFIFIPLYLRYRVYSGQMYPMSMTDMRLIDSKISPTWCQRQVVRSNATFNAFVVPSTPDLTGELVPVSMTRELQLEDDMKEYWGFYLLRGSEVTVSACVRWPGASLIMIKGYKHLQSCAYIGDDSSEELDELLEARALGLLSEDMLMEKIRQLKKEDGKANDPETMKRHKAGVSFHDPSIKVNATSSSDAVPADVTDHDPKELREILEHLHALRQAQKTESLKYYHPPSHLMSLPALHRHRDANVDRDERRWLSFKDIDGNSAQNTIKINENARRVSNEKQTEYKEDTSLVNIKTKVNKTATDSNKTDTDNKVTKNYTNLVIEEKNKEVIEPKTKNISENKPVAAESNETSTATEKQDTVVAESNETSSATEKQDTVVAESNLATAVVIDVTDNITEASTTGDANSKEVFEDVLQKLQALGDRGKRVLVRLHETMGVEYQDEQSHAHIMSAVRGTEEELERLSKVLMESIEEAKTRGARQQKRRDARDDARKKRELMLGHADLERELNEDDEPRNLAAEEDLDPDGYAEHHETLNETTAFDMSNSEFWSSFSSSEEALLECEGLILNLPLTPHAKCHSEAGEGEAMTAARANALTYRVPANGYYFFVFNSENEVQTNYIRARFDLQKTRYDVARTKLRECTNSTDRCDLLLDIFSSQKVVLEVPLRNNDSLWNEQFVIISECEPRTSIYLFCVIAVPILILVFAFQ